MQRRDERWAHELFGSVDHTDMVQERLVRWNVWATKELREEGRCVTAQRGQERFSGSWRLRTGVNLE